MRAPTPERLQKLIQAMQGRRVLLLADLVADVFLTGSPKRISREAPVLILRLEEERLVPGGGANAVANVAALGGYPLPLGVVGDDSRGHELIAALEARGVETGGILVRAGYRTPTKTRILGGARHSIKQQIVRYDTDDFVDLGEDERDRLLAYVDSVGRELGAAVLSDYGYGAVSSSLISALLDRLPPGCHLISDSRFRLGEMTGLDGATPNEEEAELLLGRPLGESPEAVAASVEEIRSRLDLRFVLVTRGSSGMVLGAGAGAALLPTHGTDQVADVTGAGDTVIGTFALALAAGAEPLEAAVLANYAGGEVVMKSGTAVVTAEELSSAVARDPLPLEELRWVSS